MEWSIESIGSIQELGNTKMHRRHVAISLLASAAGSTLPATAAEAQTCSSPCYPTTAIEAAAGVTPVNQEYPPGNLLRYGNNSQPGITDMGPALNAAILVCSAYASNPSTTAGFTLKIPGGRYRISTPIAYTWRSTAGIFDDGDMRRLNIEGDGSANTYLIYDGTTSVPALSISGYNTSSQHDGVLLHLHIKGLRLWRSLSSTGLGDGVSLAFAAQCSFEDVDIRYFNVNVKLLDCLYFCADRLFVGGGNGGLYASVSSFSHPNVFSFTNSNFSGNSAWAVLAHSPANWKFDTCSFEGNGTGPSDSHVIYVSGGPAEGGHALTVDNCYFENNHVAADIFLETGSAQPGSASIRDTTFNKTDSVRYAVNHVKASSGGAALTVSITGCGFKHFGAYSPSSANRAVKQIGANVLITVDRSNFFQSSLELPDFGASVGIGVGDAYSNLLCVARVTNSSTLVAGWNVASITKPSTGVCRITYRRSPASATVAPVISMVGNAGFGYLSAETATYFEVATKNPSGVLADMNFSVALYGY